MSDPAPILAKLEALPLFRPVGKGFVARCPVHPDDRPSLSWVVNDRGEVGMLCRAGCDKGAILAALEMTDRDYYPPQTNGHAYGQPAPAATTEYVIRRADGESVAIHVRRDLPGGKRFTWKRPGGAVGLGAIPTADLPLYGIDRLAADPDRPVTVTEGEKAADALIARGVSAVGTVTGAAGTPSTAVLGALAGCHVVLWPDADDTGRQAHGPDR